MKQIVWSEFERTFKRKKTMVLLIVYAGLLALECLFLSSMRTGFFDAENSVQVDSLNAATLFFRDISFFVNFILIPMLVVDSFNGEYTSGALRMVLIRPVSRAKLFLAKWSVQYFIILAIICITWLTGTLFGRFAMPNVESTVFLGNEAVSSFGAFLYTLRFYGIALLIYMSLISVGSFISVLMPNPILSYVGYIGVLVGAIYASDQFIFLLAVTDSIFQQLSHVNAEGFLVTLSVLLIVSIIMNLGLWKKKEWMG
ncbi:ABC transporter permease [Risungbinella massiliensis]|uniref:ABC transporter permease n=1 Tax=Risungbinella massiliensis TaxID=1329796 RepID=UPI0005CBDBA1|nr:ABC transporter permease subunit [Risungbinella massiliensis]